MTKDIVELPCTAQELENALHSVCDSGGSWGARVIADERIEPLIPAATGYVPGVTHKVTPVLRLEMQ